MKKKFYSFLSICLGGGVTALSLFLQKSLGLWFYILLIAGVFCFAASVFELVSLCKKTKTAVNTNRGEQGQEKQKPEYRRKKSLLSGAEIKLYDILSKHFSDKYLIIPQPALHTVIDKITQNAYRNELFRVCDFCLADKNTFAPLLLIELNDASHNRMDRIERDMKVNEICNLAKMPLLTIETRDLNDAGLIRKMVGKTVLKK